MSALPKKLTDLLQMLRQTSPDGEIDCDEFWEKAAQLAESDADLSNEKLLVYLHHLNICPGCEEEFSLLKSIVKDVEE